MATVKFLNAAGKYDDAAARDDVSPMRLSRCKRYLHPSKRIIRSESDTLWCHFIVMNR